MNLIVEMERYLRTVLETNVVIYNGGGHRSRDFNYVVEEFDFRAVFCSFCFRFPLFMFCILPLQLELVHYSLSREGMHERCPPKGCLFYTESYFSSATTLETLEIFVKWRLFKKLHSPAKKWSRRTVHKLVLALSSKWLFRRLTRWNWGREEGKWIISFVGFGVHSNSAVVADKLSRFVAFDCWTYMDPPDCWISNL